MRLTVREAASYLQVDEATVRQWIKKRGLPAQEINQRLHLNAVELWQWATENGVTVSRRLLDDARQAPEDVP
ncbi:MAG TPA: helix-turn-helix domain-containing protein, partial [Gemmatimonadales bacterium]|nr:helix-turn-helix domain-containing protein [Gemmatimonadales bacterium]